MDYLDQSPLSPWTITHTWTTTLPGSVPAVPLNHHPHLNYNLTWISPHCPSEPSPTPELQPYLDQSPLSPWTITHTWTTTLPGSVPTVPLNHHPHLNYNLTWISPHCPPEPSPTPELQPYLDQSPRSPWTITHTWTTTLPGSVPTVPLNHHPHLNYNLTWISPHCPPEPSPTPELQPYLDQSPLSLWTITHTWTTTLPGSVPTVPLNHHPHLNYNLTWISPHCPSEPSPTPELQPYLDQSPLSPWTITHTWTTTLPGSVPTVPLNHHPHLNYNLTWISPHCPSEPSPTPELQPYLDQSPLSLWTITHTWTTTLPGSVPTVPLNHHPHLNYNLTWISPHCPSEPSPTPELQPYLDLSPWTITHTWTTTLPGSVPTVPLNHHPHLNYNLTWISPHCPSEPSPTPELQPYLDLSPWTITHTWTTTLPGSVPTVPLNHHPHLNYNLTWISPHCPPEPSPTPELQPYLDQSPLFHLSHKQTGSPSPFSVAFCTNKTERVTKYSPCL